MTVRSQNKPDLLYLVTTASRVPNLSDEFGETWQAVSTRQCSQAAIVQTNVVGIKLVDSHEDSNGCSAESPFDRGPQAGKLPLVEVIDDDAVELGKARSA
jgi:hypothetical protein